MGKHCELVKIYFSVVKNYLLFGKQLFLNWEKFITKLIPPLGYFVRGCLAYGKHCKHCRTFISQLGIIRFSIGKHSLLKSPLLGYIVQRNVAFGK